MSFLLLKTPCSPTQEQVLLPFLQVGSALLKPYSQSLLDSWNPRCFKLPSCYLDNVLFRFLLVYFYRIGTSSANAPEVLE